MKRLRSPRLRRPIVLIMDDEPAARGALVRVLQLRGYEVVETDTVVDAVSVLGESAVDAAVLDVRIPSGSGLDVLTPLRQHLELKKIPVLVWTGSMLSEDEEWAVTRHGAHLFQKPEIRALVNFLDQLLDRDTPN
ncbi:MAG TPA: hypothetical protein DCP38_00490 [Acidobacteria bacterium]|nr:hypothetical protein [Acidobacteriota bacterium]MDP6372215.1 response regulator [Vicinamibacterales bacterium]HAK53947.1 hypothetical protein [Acidobacteriota bacterium]